MSSTFSVIGDLYGVKTPRRPARPGGFGLVVVVLMVGMFLYESVHPVMRLRSERPPSNAAAAGYDNRDVAAPLYWQVAANFASE